MREGGRKSGLMSPNQPDALVRRKGDYGSYGRQDNASEEEQEATGSWYWLVDEMEEAGLNPPTWCSRSPPDACWDTMVFSTAGLLHESVQRHQSFDVGEQLALFKAKLDLLNIVQVFKRIALQSKKASFVALSDCSNQPVRKDRLWGHLRPHVEQSKIVKETQIRNVPKLRRR